MNYNDVETKFQRLENRLQRLSSYFDPSVRLKYQHPYIKDLSQDYFEDCKMFNLNKYIKKSQNFAKSSSLSPKNSENSRISSKKSEKKAKILKPKRKQIKIESMKEIKTDVDYKGFFSSTKLIPNRSQKRKSLELLPKKIIESWADEIKNPSTESFLLENLIYDTKQPQSYPKDISFEYIKKSFLEVSKFSSINNKNPEINPLDDFRQRTRVINDINIRYQTDPNIEIKADKGSYEIIITDIVNFNKKKYFFNAENGFIQFEHGKKLNLLNEFTNIKNCIFLITIKNSSFYESFYIQFSKFSHEIEEKTLKLIKTFNDLQNRKTLKKLKLPLISEEHSKDSDKKKAFYTNPITNSLYNYKKITKMFSPNSYLAKLNFFKNHDFICARYSKKFNKFLYDSP